MLQSDPIENTQALDEALDISPEATAADSTAALSDSTARADALLLPESFEEAFRPFDPVLDTARLEYLAAPDTAWASVDELQAEAVAPMAWEEGLEPLPRADQPGTRAGFLAMIALIFVLLAYNFRHLGRLLRTYGEELVKVRLRRDNVFDERPAADARILLLLLMQFVVCGGILLSGALHIFGGNIGPLPVLSVVKVIAIVGIYYIFQFVAYQTVGYTFTTSAGRREWVRGFNASQALLGLALAVPAVLSVFYPVTALYMVVLGAVLYFCGRILFILKGFRIFYDKFSSLLYFILYLCTLEIIPLILVYECSVIEFV